MVGQAFVLSPQPGHSDYAHLNFLSVRLDTNDDRAGATLRTASYPDLYLRPRDCVCWVGKRNHPSDLGETRTTGLARVAMGAG